MRKRKTVAKKKATKKRAVKKTASTRNPKLTMAEGWQATFKGNEKAKKSDDNLIKQMEKMFPDSKGKSTITRVSMQRCCYNKGSAMFAALGAATKKSFRYIDGIKKESNKTSAPAKKKAVKRTAKKKAVKKRATKKRSAKRKAGSK